jgi:hypothetical protein
MFVGTAALGGFWGRAEDRFRGVCFWSIFYGISWVALLGSIALRLSLAITGAVGLLIGATHGLAAVQAISGAKEQVETSKTGALLGTMNMLVIFIAVLFQWGTGIIINLFPGARPGEFTSRGFFVCFFFVTVLILGSLLALYPLRRAESGKDRKTPTSRRL